MQVLLADNGEAAHSGMVNLQIYTQMNKHDGRVQVKRLMTLLGLLKTRFTLPHRCNTMDPSNADFESEAQNKECIFLSTYNHGS